MAPTAESLDDHRHRKQARADGRVPPHHLEAEQALLGAMLMAETARDAALEAGLTGADFYKPTHGHVFDTIARLHDEGLAVDIRIVSDRLRRDGMLDTIGGDGELLHLQAGTPQTAHAGRYARIVADHALLRHMIGVAGEVAELGYSLPSDVDAALDLAEATLLAVGDRRRHGSDAIPLAAAFGRHLDLLEARASGSITLGATTGLHDLDNVIGGLAPGQLITIAGRPGMAKTSTGLGFALSAAEAGTPSLFVSIEMGEQELLDRVTANVARVPLDHLRRGALTPKDWDRVSAAAGQISELPLQLLDRAGATIAEIRAVARRGVRQGVRLVVVDYLQIVHVNTPSRDRRVDVDEITRGLKRIARDLGVAVVALCQINRGVEGRADKRPLLSDLRESGQIEQESDVVLGLYRDEYYREDSPDKGTIEMIVLKQRQGVSGITVRAAFLGHYQRVANMVSQIGPGGRL